MTVSLEALRQKSSSLTSFVSQFRKALEVHAKQHGKDRDHLNRSVDMPCLQEMTITKCLKMDFKLDALDEEVEFIDKQSSVCCFSPPPYLGRNNKQNDFLQTSLLASLEEEIEQNEKFCEKKSTTSFIDGRKDHINDIISTIANIACVAKFILESKDCPLVISFIMEVAETI